MFYSRLSIVFWNEIKRIIKRHQLFKAQVVNANFQPSKALNNLSAIVEISFKQKSEDSSVQEIVKKNLLTPEVANSVSFLGLEEMLQVICGI